MKKIKMNVVDIRPVEEDKRILEPMITGREQFGIVKAMTEAFIRPPYEHDKVLKEKLKDINNVSFSNLKKFIFVLPENLFFLI